MWSGLGWWSFMAPQRWDFILIIFGCGYVITGFQRSCKALVKEDYIFSTCQTSGSHAHVTLKEVCFRSLSPAVGHFFHVCIPPQVPAMATNFSTVLPGRLWDGPSSPCRLQDTSCWAPPATSSTSCRRSRQQRLWACRRRAGSGSCGVCCWEELHSCDRLEPGEVGGRTHLWHFPVQFFPFVLLRTCCLSRSCSLKHFCGQRNK